MPPTPQKIRPYQAIIINQHDTNIMMQTNSHQEPTSFFLRGKNTWFAAGCRTCFDTPPVVQPRFCCHWNPPHSLNYLQYLGCDGRFLRREALIDNQPNDFLLPPINHWVSKERLNYLCNFFSCGRLIFWHYRKNIYIYTHTHTDNHLLFTLLRGNCWHQLHLSSNCKVQVEPVTPITRVTTGANLKQVQSPWYRK